MATLGPAWGRDRRNRHDLVLRGPGGGNHERIALSAGRPASGSDAQLRQPAAAWPPRGGHRPGNARQSRQPRSPRPWCGKPGRRRAATTDDQLQLLNWMHARRSFDDRDQKASSGCAGQVGNGALPTTLRLRPTHCDRLACRLRRRHEILTRPFPPAPVTEDEHLRARSLGRRAHVRRRRRCGVSDLRTAPVRIRFLSPWVTLFPEIPGSGSPNFDGQ